ncbi:uncharacterized protein K460DRAFT_272682 [Cucurbitaria berberidis CBS 394.84]|uniref:MARVEL domain-containing protein n=1 Tax=Cucurbitaria berberidis CBS 394.84 TaxID=1168544 RepID=A0A9P4LDT5_9PLEO|nr:uncharacterized protein K460DRAFT_272682 [Cucurbitaria berberidis CBS 394.84]KAF1851153.1 hypothetical protein K460DRAFT_272682 [Cucurbitaria berberidis CBS 394.84]
MRIPQSYIQKCKATAHGFQAILVFIAACLTIAVMIKDGSTGGPTKFYLAMCFVSIPAIIYLVMVPMWSRAQRFGNAYAFLAVDALYTMLWFAAFVAVAVWNSHGIKEGAKEKKVSDNERNCTTFKYGSESKCKVSKAAVGIGSLLFLFFAITTAVSSYYLLKFLREGVLPYESSAPNPHHISGETSKDNAWSAEIEPGHRDSIDSVDRLTEHGGNQQEDEYALLNSTETDEGRHPGRPLSWGEDRTGYGRPMPSYADYRDGPRPGAGDALSPGGYEEYRQAAGSPGVGGENKQTSQSGSGYSFSGGGVR